MKFQHCYIDKKGNIWRTQTLIEASEDLPVQNFQLILLSRDTIIRWKLDNVRDYCNHYKRVSNADLTIPIILGPDGNIMDGYHRCIKAICEGHTFLLSKQLKVLPEPDFKE